MPETLPQDRKLCMPWAEVTSITKGCCGCEQILFDPHIQTHLNIVNKCVLQFPKHLQIAGKKTHPISWCSIVINRHMENSSSQSWGALKSWGAHLKMFAEEQVSDPLAPWKAPLPRPSSQRNIPLPSHPPPQPPHRLPCGKTPATNFSKDQLLKSRPVRRTGE